MQQVFLQKLVQIQSSLQHGNYDPGNAFDPEKRRFVIGGSEFNHIVRDDLKTLAKHKMSDLLGINKFSGSEHTRWGNLFEPATKKWLEKNLECRIFESFNVPGCISGTSYSPDGLLLVEKSVLEKFVSVENLPDLVSVLLEIKSPSVREIDQIVPFNYVPQIKCGLCHFPLVDIGLFVNVKYRLCENEHLATKGAYLNSNFRGNPRNESVFGIIGIVYTGDNKDKLAEFENLPDSRKLTENLSLWYSEFLCNEYDQKYYPPADFINPETDKKTLLKLVRNFLSDCEKNANVYVGYLVYKMFDFAVLRVDREPDYVAKYAKKIQAYMDGLKNVKKCLDDTIETSERLRVFDEACSAQLIFTNPKSFDN